MLHIVIMIAAAAGILRLLKRILPARLAARLPEVRSEGPGVDRRHLLVAVLAVVATLIVSNVVDLGALAGSVNGFFKELHGL
jgi:hypothetical protein